MKSIGLLHNPSAGDEEHSKKDLIALIESNGYTCTYTSTKETDWQIEDNSDLLIIAGGDGTVRKVAEKLVNRRLAQKQFPIALLPMGTANNIASTLGYTGDPAEMIQSWQTEKVQPVDIGKISGSEETFFLEGFGFGVFPRLMKEMKNRSSEASTPQKELQTALETLIEIIDTYKGKDCTLQIDGIDHSGKFLLVEVLNIRSIGPNLTLAPHADPGDGFFDVVLISDDHRDDFRHYISNKLKGIDEPPIFNTIRAKKITIKWTGKLAHADDQLITADKQEVSIDLLDGILKFVVTEISGKAEQ